MRQVTSLRSIRLISWAVIIYIILATGWWGILLYREHQELYKSYEVILRHEMMNDNEAEVFEPLQGMTPADLVRERKRRAAMIIGEALFLALSLLAGLWVIRIAYGKVVRVEQMKQNFILAVSHELKTPIASTQLALESLKKILSKNKSISKTSCEEIIDQGLKESTRLYALVENILLSTKIETGYTPDIQSFEVEALLKRIQRSLRLPYPDREWNLSLDPNPMQIEIDKKAFEIVCLNLIENALKYSPNDCPIHISVASSQNELQLKVVDHGPGIPSIERKRVFDRFYRIGDDDRPQSKGTGLGLFIVKELVEVNHGHITIKDNPDGGTIMEVRWPLEKT